MQLADLCGEKSGAQLSGKADTGVPQPQHARLKRRDPAELVHPKKYLLTNTKCHYSIAGTSVSF